MTEPEQQSQNGWSHHSQKLELNSETVQAGNAVPMLEVLGINNLSKLKQHEIEI